jgi:hypothetical protein
MLLPGSLAIDYGLGCPDIDQHGVPQPIGPACDVDSVEYGWLVFLPAVVRWSITGPNQATIPSTNRIDFAHSLMQSSSILHN